MRINKKMDELKRGVATIIELPIMTDKIVLAKEEDGSTSLFAVDEST